MKPVPNSQEPHALLQHAELLIEARQLPDALTLYDRIIEQSRPASYLLQRRGWLRRLTGNFTGSVVDYDQAIELSPDDASLYCDRGACLSHRMSNMPDLDTKSKMECLIQVINNYHACVERDPANASAWLALAETYLLQHDWDSAIASYALCRPYINTDQYRLVRAWLGCLAMCLAGDTIEDEDKRLLRDKKTKLHRTSWCVAEIDRLLDELASDSYDNTALGCAMDLQQLFLDHFVEKPIRRENKPS